MVNLMTILTSCMGNKCVIYILGEAHETLETSKSFFGDQDDEDRPGGEEFM